MVVAHTISDRCLPRNAGSARSTAAYLAWRFAAEPPPNSAMLANSIGSELHRAARTTPIAPATATA